MDALSSSLSYRNFKLQDAASIVRCSFMMRRNICALDLSLLEFSVYKKHVVSSSQRNLLKALMGFFNTEEQIRKFLVRDRNILCTLHLDIPQGREPSLRNNEILDSVDFLVDPKSFHVGSIFIPDFWHEEKLQGFVIQSVYKSHHKLLTLSRILKNDGAMYNVEMPLYVMRYDLGVLCFEWNDSDSAKGVIIGFNIRETTLYAKRPKISQIHTFGGFQLQGKVHHEGCIIHELVLGCIFEFIPSLLEYGLSLKVSDAEYKQLKESIILSELLEGDEPVFVDEGKRSTRRRYLLMQVLHILSFVDDYPELADFALDSLHLIWRSIPDPVLSRKEMQHAYQGVLDEEFFNRLNTIYEYSVDEFPEVAEPRSLKHLSRVALREVTLNNRKFPDGLDYIGLPLPILALLRLKE